MTFSETSNDRAAAHLILDLCRAGAGEKEGVTRALVDWALRKSGDLLGLREFTDDGQPVFVLERKA